MLVDKLEHAAGAVRLALLRELEPVVAGKWEGAALEALARWSRHRAGYVPSTRTWRAVVADSVLRRLAGQSLDVFRGAERERAVREFVREAERPPTVMRWMARRAAGTAMRAGMVMPVLLTQS